MIFYDKNLKCVKRTHFLNNLKIFFNNILFILLFPFRLTGKIISNIFYKAYNRYYPARSSIKKRFKILIAIIDIIVIGYVVYCIVNNVFSTIYFLTIIPVSIVLYLIIKLLLYIYHLLIGEYQLLEQHASFTKEYVVTYLPKLIKVFGPTGAGKDTWQVGCSSILARYLKEKTINDMNHIKNICYIFDFDLLDIDLFNNFKKFLSFSRKVLKENFLKYAKNRNYYIKKYYQRKGLKPDELINDLQKFEDDPFYPSKYVYGTGVNAKHFLQLIMYEYIEFFIRVNIEKNFILSNQPLIEDFDSGLTAKKFSFHFIRTKTDFKIVDKVKKYENVFFPWKDRLIISETECGSWYMNRDGETISEIIHSGMRDFKAYQRHFVDSLYWFQVDQAPERTAKLFRELDHVYAAVLSRIEVEGGKKKNLILNIFLKYYDKKIFKIENRINRRNFKAIKAKPKLDYLMELYFASSNIKYKNKHDKYKKKLVLKPIPDKYELYKSKISILEKKIEANKKDGYIIETVCISKTPQSPSEYTVKPIKDLLDPNANRTSFVTQFIFHTSDCERYDTRYMRSLAESRSEVTKIRLAEIPNWNVNMKLSKEDVLFMGYTAAKDTFGLSEKDYDDFRYTDKYKNYLKKL